jgi:hypothetical protein
MIDRSGLDAFGRRHAIELADLLQAFLQHYTVDAVVIRFTLGELLARELATLDKASVTKVFGDWISEVVRRETAHRERQHTSEGAGQ